MPSSHFLRQSDTIYIISTPGTHIGLWHTFQHALPACRIFASRMSRTQAPGLLRKAASYGRHRSALVAHTRIHRSWEAQDYAQPINILSSPDLPSLELLRGVRLCAAASCGCALSAGQVLPDTQSESLPITTHHPFKPPSLKTSTISPDRSIFVTCASH